jgi:urea transport system ATP-binding protein
LRDVSLEAKLGEVTVLLGRNGVGKTTLLKSLMGVVPVKSGSVVLGSEDLTRATPYERARAGVGYVPQGREIFARLTVKENLQMGLATQPGSTPIPPELFELFPVLKQMLHNLRLQERWLLNPSYLSWTNLQKAFNLASSKTLAE